MNIKKASAGSGKTYALAHTYLDLLLGSKDRYAYRHILAVTFTNKATAEMKSRILRELSDLARTDARAKEILTDILHDYGSFAISTIDKFFQQTLKAFSREIGQFSDYQIELDRDSLIRESMDRILDSLTEDKPELVQWIRSSVTESLEQGERFNLDRALYEMGKVLKSEDHREMALRYGIDETKAYDKANLEKIKSECLTTIKDFETKAASFGIVAEPGKKLSKPGGRALKSAPEGLVELFDGPYKRYNTAVIIRNFIFTLGFAGEFYAEFDNLLKEKNVMCLDESNTILKDIIDGSDAPFVYEKLGVRFDNFLLDEFQDTSNIQWENFLPLLRESESRGGQNLIVGDVKQSIYRFRDSDWELLGSKVHEQFPDACVEPMDSNWRSLAQVVNFNNDFFGSTARKLGLQEIYSDVRQLVKSDDPQPGYVRVTFCDDQMAAVIQSVNMAGKAGARWGDIAILVRNRKEGSNIASELIRNGIPVISDDSLNLKSSVVVRRLVSLLSCLENPEDGINSFLADSLDVSFPECYHSLTDLGENLLRKLKSADPESFDGETLYVQAFMDDLREWTALNGNNLRHYLKHWNEQEFYIGSPESSDSVRVLTIHKSKGLEFPYVIFPYSEKVKLFKNSVRWCGYDGNIYPVELGPSSVDTAFCDDYLEERRKQYVDNINIFYVALTRACKCLHVISGVPSKKFREGMKKGNPEYKNMSELLYEHCGGFEDREYGEMYDFSAMERKSDDGPVDFPAAYPSFDLEGRLAPSADASDFFGEDGVTGVSASARLAGIVLHGILSALERPEDIDIAVSRAVSDGLLPGEDAGEYSALLRDRVNSHREWFETKGRNEVSIIGPDGREHRPDRVVFGDDSVLVIDYKFGEPRSAYRRQVGDYVNLYRSMGYRNVSGVVWYVREDRVETV